MRHRIVEWRDERGAVAVIFAICALMIFGLAAIGVDLGNAMNRKKQTQTSADFAALAGADGLPDTSDATRQLVANYLNKNQPATDGTDKCDTSSGPVTAADLRDGNLLNGEVTFPSTDQIKVVSPASKVDFGLANALGFSNTCVAAAATARIGSGAMGMAPYYVTGPCSSGPQTMKDNSGGLSIPYTVPVLSHDTESNGATLTGITPTSIPLANVGDPAGPVVTLTGTGLGAASIDKVGFFNSDLGEPTTAVPEVTPAQSATSVSVKVPNAVASYQDVWYVRVHDPAPQPGFPDGRWSARLQAQPLQVGAAVLACDPDSSSGNFGSIDLPGWGGNSNDHVARNIAYGLKPPLTLKEYPSPYPAPNACKTDSRSVMSTGETPPALKSDTNCVESVTGLRADPASQGYLNDSDQNPPGKLRVDTNPTCQTLGQPARDHGTTPGHDLDVNADLLSCFLVNNTLKISDTIHYDGTNALFTQDIWKSPRFVQVPVLTQDPNGDKWMPIVSFVPGFITDQPTGASRLSPTQGTDTDNGLVVTWHGSTPSLRAVRIIFFDIDALPPQPDGGQIMDYVGDGKKSITMTN